MNELKIISRTKFESVSLDIYGDNNTFYMTREQAGQALEYANPGMSIGNIHKRHRDRLDGLSTYIKLINVEGGRMVERETIVYTLKGVMELCRHSHQRKADAFMDFTWDIMERLLRGETIRLSPTSTDYLEACGVVKPSKEISDIEVTKQLLQAIQEALESGEYYLIRKQSRYRRNDSTLLGLYDDTYITVIAPIAGEIYARSVGDTRSIKTINQHIAVALTNTGTMEPRKRSYAGRNVGDGNKKRSCFRIIIQSANAISGFTAPALLTAKG